MWVHINWNWDEIIAWSVLVYRIFSINQINCKIWVKVCVWYLRKFICCSKVALSCLQHKKLLETPKVVKKLQSIYMYSRPGKWIPTRSQWTPSYNHTCNHSYNHVIILQNDYKNYAGVHWLRVGIRFPIGLLIWVVKPFLGRSWMQLLAHSNQCKLSWCPCQLFLT